MTALMAYATYQPGRLTQRQKAFLIILFLIALALRVGLIFRYESYKNPGDYEFGQVARNILEGKGYWGDFGYAKPGPTAIPYPLYTYFLAGAYKFLPAGERYLVIMLFQAVLASFVPVFSYLIARRVFSPRVAALAGIFVALNYFLAITPTYIGHSTFHVFLLSAAVLVLLRVKADYGFANALLCGALFGLTALTKTSVLFFLVVAGVWLLWRGRASFARRFACVVIVAIVAAAVITPWTVRNYRVFGRFVPISSGGGLNFWMGNNPAATGGDHTADGQDMKSQAKKYREFNEVEAGDLYYEEAFTFIAKNPATFFWLRCKALFYTFFNLNYWMDPALFPYNPTLKWLTVAMMAAAIAGFVVSLRYWPRGAIILCLIAVYALLYAAFHADVDNRFRLPLDPFLMMYIACLAAAVIELVRGPEPLPAIIMDETDL